MFGIFFFFGCVMSPTYKFHYVISKCSQLHVILLLVDLILSCVLILNLCSLVFCLSTYLCSNSNRQNCFVDADGILLRFAFIDFLCVMLVYIVHYLYTLIEG